MTCSPACTDGNVCDDGTCKCPAELTSCGGTCFDVTSDLSHCGACNALCNNGRECVGSKCGCPSNDAYCSNACVDTANSATDCGGCGKACGAPRLCISGACGCPDGATYCDGDCVNVQTDITNCGTCGTTCSGAAICGAGKCSTCATGCAIVTSTIAADGYSAFAMNLPSPVNLRGTVVRARVYIASTVQPESIRLYFDDLRTSSGTSYAAPAGSVGPGWYDLVFDINSASVEAGGATLLGLNLGLHSGTTTLYVDSIAVTPAVAGPWNFTSSGSPLTLVEGTATSGTVSWRGQ